MTPRYRATVALSLEFEVSGDSTGDAVQRAMEIVMARPGMRADQISTIQVQPVLAYDPVAAATEANVAYWQESEAILHGTARQLQLWEQAALPDDELARIARDVLFAPFAGCRRRVRMGAGSIHQRLVPGEWVCLGAISWSSRACPLDVSSWELDALHRVTTAAQLASEHPWLRVAPHNFVVELRQHTGTCGKCGRSATDVSALTSIQWAGRTLSKEYAL